MKTLPGLLFAALPIAILATAATARAGHDRTSRLVRELERQTDHLVEDLEHDFRHRGHATCRHSAEGRFYRAIKEVERQADTLHSRIRGNRSMCSRAEAFRAIRCAYNDARGLLHRVDLDRHIADLVREVGRRIDDLACEFDGHARARVPSRDPDPGRNHIDRGHVTIDAGPEGLRIDAALLAHLLHAFGR